MSASEEELIGLIDKFGKEIDRERPSIPVESESNIDENAPSDPGIYWIETTMPVDKMQNAISVVLGKSKRIRKKAPNGTKIINQDNESLYVVYIGTEGNIRMRLKQHLFNIGCTDTVKLGCVINKPPFNEYKWHIGFRKIDSY